MAVHNSLTPDYGAHVYTELDFFFFSLFLIHHRQEVMFRTGKVLFFLLAGRLVVGRPADRRPTVGSGACIASGAEKR